MSSCVPTRVPSNAAALHRQISAVRPQLSKQMFTQNRRIADEARG